MSPEINSAFAAFLAAPAINTLVMARVDLELKSAIPPPIFLSVEITGAGVVIGFVKKVGITDIDASGVGVKSTFGVGFPDGDWEGLGEDVGDGEGLVVAETEGVGVDDA